MNRPALEPDSDHPSDRLRGLCRNVIDRQLDKDDFDELCRLLTESEEARRYYLDAIEMDTLLRTAASRGIDPSEDAFEMGALASALDPESPISDSLGSNLDARTPERQNASKHNHWTIVRWLVAASVLAAGGFWWQQRTNEPPIAPESSGSRVASADRTPPESDSTDIDSQDRETPEDPSGRIVSDGPRSSSKGASGFTPLPDLSSDESVAVVVRREGVDIEGLEVGDRLGRGLLRFDSGLIQVEFFGGAIVLLQGPAEIRLESPDAAKLNYGMARAVVSDRAKGFQLMTPDAALVDLGTEFSVGVQEGQGSQVDVVSGEVEVSLLGDDGNSLVTRRLTDEDDGRLVIQSDRQVLDLKPKSLGAPAPIQTDFNQPLAVLPAYVEAVKRSAPMHYWRFDPESPLRDDGSGTNQLIKNGPDELITFEDGLARFHRRRGVSRYLQTSEPLQFSQVDEYTFEMWVNPENLDHVTLLNTIPSESTSGSIQMNVIEIVTDTFLVHEPGAFRFLHRFPPSRNVVNDQNAFTPGQCSPGRWHHIVAVKRAGQLDLFLNGKLKRRVELDLTGIPDDCHLMVGQLRREEPIRQFAGTVDEIAIYDRGLSAVEVREHFDRMGVDQ